jgi:hypothetical protein
MQGPCLLLTMLMVGCGFDGSGDPSGQGPVAAGPPIVAGDLTISGMVGNRVFGGDYHAAIWVDTGNVLSSSLCLPGNHMKAAVNPDGSFTFAGLSPADYRLVVFRATDKSQLAGLDPVDPDNEVQPAELAHQIVSLVDQDLYLSTLPVPPPLSVRTSKGKHNVAWTVPVGFDPRALGTRDNVLCGRLTELSVRFFAPSFYTDTKGYDLTKIIVERALAPGQIGQMAINITR